MYLQSKDLNLEELEDLIKNLKKDDFKYLFQSRLKNYDYDYFNIDIIKAHELNSLNLFSNTGELKVRKLEDNLYRCVYLGEKNINLNLDDFSSEMKYIKEEEIFTILWGENRPNQDNFIEQTIPHEFNYPIDLKQLKSNQRVVLKQILYLNSYGNPEFIRNYDLEIKTEEELCR
ncbi:MAG: hypothetical protein U0354_15485 [Candidatus Sericytochromatia bacterium]